MPRREGTLDGLDLLRRTPTLVVGHVLGHARHADCPAAVVRECAPGAAEPPHVAVGATYAELRHVTLEVAQGAGNLGLDPGAVLGMYQRHHVLESGGEASQLGPEQLVHLRSPAHPARVHVPVPGADLRGRHAELQRILDVVDVRAVRKVVRRRPVHRAKPYFQAAHEVFQPRNIRL